MISFSDLISFINFHSEWFSGHWTGLEAMGALLRRLGLFISYLPWSFFPKQVLIGSEEHCSGYLVRRKDNGVVYYTKNFEPGDLFFEITDYLLLSGDLSWVFCSVKRKSNPCFCTLTISRKPESAIVAQVELGSNASLSDQPPKNKTIVRRRQPGKPKQLKQRYGDSITPYSFTCQVFVGKFTDGENTDCKGCIACSNSERRFQGECSDIKKGEVGHAEPKNCHVHSISWNINPMNCYLQDCYTLWA